MSLSKYELRCYANYAASCNKIMSFEELKEQFDFRGIKVREKDYKLYLDLVEESKKVVENRKKAQLDLSNYKDRTIIETKDDFIKYIPTEESKEEILNEEIDDENKVDNDVLQDLFNDEDEDDDDVLQIEDNGYTYVVEWFRGGRIGKNGKFEVLAHLRKFDKDGNYIHTEECYFSDPNK